MAYKLQKQGNTVFAEYNGTLHRIIDPNSLGVDLNTIEERPAIGGTSGSDMSFAQLNQRVSQDTAFEASRNPVLTPEQKLGTVEAYKQGVLGRDLTENDKQLLANKGVAMAGYTAKAPGLPPVASQNAPQAMETPQVGAGQLLSGPSQLQGLSEADIARTSGANIYRRDLNKEQQALAGYSASFGAPDFTKPEAVKKFNEYVYEGKGTRTASPTTPTNQALTLSDLGTTPSVDFSQLTPMQQSVQKIIDATLKMTESLAGESAERAKLEGEYGLPEDLKTKTDLTNQLRVLQAEAASITPQILEGAVGKGITSQILGRQEQALINQNAIKSLSVSALLQAVNGNIETSNALIDRQVGIKFNPIKEQIQIAKDNLSLIISSPEYTRQEKAQAAAQKKIQDDKANEIQKKEDEYTAIQKIAVEVAAAKLGVSSTILQKIQNAGSEVEAMRLAAPYLVAPVVPTTPTPTSVISETGEIITPEQPIIGLTGKPLTDAQNTSLGYAQRVNDANKTINELGSKMTGKIGIISGASWFPNILKSSDRQSFEQAQRNFINAVLRKESGAAISPSEFDSAAKQYFPQPGDSASTLAQKTVNRERIIKNLLQSANVSTSVLGEQSAGGSYEDYLNAIK